MLCIVALLASLAGVVMLSEVWQRMVALLAAGIIVFLISQSAIVIGQKELMAWNYGRNIQPTDKLWSKIRKEIESGQYDQAKAELAIITTNWSKIGAWPESYSAADILKKIEETNKANNPAHATARTLAAPGR
jgi:outer membrane protein assembly factor BamD (BamD/ComL family)